MSPAYERFFDSVYNRPKSRTDYEQLDLEALRSLNDIEREQALTLLLQRLSEVDDPRVVEALVQLKARQALPLLRRKLARNLSGSFALSVADALWELDGDASGLPHLRKMALDERDEDLRGLAIAALGRMPCRLTLELLTELLYSPLAMVRAQAVSALAAQHGVGRAFLDHHDLLGMLRLSIASPLQSVRTETVQEVRELFAHLRSGTSPTELRLDRRIDPAVPWLCRLRESYLADDPQSPHFDVTSLLALTGFEREWVERLLITFLPRDRRAIEALVQLGARRALPALAELLQRAGRTDAAELSAAVAAISRA